MSEPIFIHSLFRSGSTYLFEVFRRAGDSYSCYQEPFHEKLIKLNSAPNQLLEFDKEAQLGLRHPTLKKPYFYEFTQIQDKLQGLFDKDFSYEQYFTNIDDPSFIDQKTYIETLIKNSQGTPVLQFCRTSGRIHALKESFPGIHIHLWREPRNQWWSYNINSYFPSTTQLIYSSKNLPDPLKRIKTIAELNNFVFKEYAYDLDNFDRLSFDFRTSYLMFYALWIYSFINFKKNTKTSINIDKLDIDSSYRVNILENLKELEINNINFDDCKSPFFIFSENESSIFNAIEDEVHSIFINSGFKKSDIDFSIKENGLIRKKQEQYKQGNEFYIDAEKSRNTFISYLNNNSSTVEKILSEEINKKGHAEQKANFYEQEVLAMLQSRSWKITKPLRDLGTFGRYFKRKSHDFLTLAPDSITRELLLRLLLISKHFIVRYPLLKNQLLKALMISPKISSSIFHLLGEKNDFTKPPDYPVSETDLSPRAGKIYVQLKEQISKREHS